MIISDTRSRLPSADICIVGAGPVGLALAFKLEALDLTVLVLEGGPINGEETTASDFEFVNGHHALPGATTHCGIGGTSHLWGGRCVTFDDIDFEQRDHVPSSGWPIEHASMARHYQEASAFLDAGKITPRTTSCETEAIVADAMERWSRNLQLGPRYEKRLRESQRIVLATRTLVTDLVPAPGLGHVAHLRVYRHGQPEVVDVDHVVVAAGGLETVRLLLALQKQRPQISGGPDGPLGRYYQGHLTGSLAVIHLTDDTMIRHLAFQMDHDGYRFRQRLQPSPCIQKQERLLNTVFWLDAISISDPAHGSCSLSFLYLLLAGSGIYSRISSKRAPRAASTKSARLRGHLRNIRFGDRSLRCACRSWNHLRRGREDGMLANPAGRYLLRYQAEQVPDPCSRVQLGETADGRPKMTVDYRVGEDDLSSVLRSHVLLDDWLRINSFGKLEYLYDEAERRQGVLDQAFDGYHQIGLARMSQDHRQGVVDRNCRVHDVDNLYLAGASVFPTGSHANPTLPAVALALRLAEHLAGLLQKPSNPANP